MNKTELTNRLRLFRAGELPRLRLLGDYFAGRHKILTEGKDPGKPDNRLVNNFCRAITDSTVGYFMGIPVSYGCDDRDTLGEIIRIGGVNDEPFINSALATDLSVYGRAAEIFWCDMDGEVRFVPVSPTTIFPIFSEDVDETLLGVCRTFVRSDGTIHVQYADSEGIYDFDEKNGDLISTAEREHLFGCVPANFYRNNRDMTGDFEPVLSLVDAYNRLESECVNDFELFADSYLVISGMGGTTAEDLEKIRRERVLLLDEGGEAKWLTKSVNDVYIENLKTRIVKDIYRFSGTADISEAERGGTLTSGVAMKYRMIPFENRVAVTEQFFRRGLRRRMAVIESLYGNMSRHFDASGLRVHFARNLPGQMEAAADVAEKLKGIVSRRTLLELMPFIGDAEEEMRRIAAEGGMADEV